KAAPARQGNWPGQPTRPGSLPWGAGPPPRGPEHGPNLRDRVIPRDQESQIDGAQELEFQVAAEHPLERVTPHDEGSTGPFQGVEGAAGPPRRARLPRVASRSRAEPRVPPATARQEDQPHGQEDALSRSRLDHQAEIAEDQVLGDRLGRMQQALERVERL